MNEPTESSQPENPLCDCVSPSRVGRSDGWYCAECGGWLCSLTGRVSVRDLEPYTYSEPKRVARAYVRKHGADAWVDLGPVEDLTVSYSYSEAEQALLKHFYGTFGPFDVSGDHEWGDEVS